MSEPLRALWGRGVQSFTVEILFSPLFLFHNLERLNGMGISLYQPRRFVTEGQMYCHGNASWWHRP
jgi:hypothetical protein